MTLVVCRSFSPSSPSSFLIQIAYKYCFFLFFNFLLFYEFSFACILFCHLRYCSRCSSFFFHLLRLLVCLFIFSGEHPKSHSMRSTKSVRLIFIQRYTHQIRLVHFIINDLKCAIIFYSHVVHITYNPRLTVAIADIRLLEQFKYSHSHTRRLFYDQKKNLSREF